MKPDKKEVGKRIFEIRTSGKYTMEDFGRIIDGAPKSSVNNWEKGVSIPQRPKLERIALIGHTTPDKLLYGSIDEYLLKLAKHSFPNIDFKDDTLGQHQILEIVKIQGKQKNLSFKDDLDWIQLIKTNVDQMSNHNDNSLIYLPFPMKFGNYYVAEFKDHYTGKNSIVEELVPQYYVYADSDNQELFLYPFTFQMDNYDVLLKLPEKLFEKGGHAYFTNDFSSIGLDIEKTTVYYSWLDELDNFNSQMTILQYDKKQNKFVVADHESDRDIFQHELLKDQLWLRNSELKD